MLTNCFSLFMELLHLKNSLIFLIHKMMSVSCRERMNYDFIIYVNIPGNKISHVIKHSKTKICSGNKLQETTGSLMQTIPKLSYWMLLIVYKTADGIANFQRRFMLLKNRKNPSVHFWFIVSQNINFREIYIRNEKLYRVYCSSKFQKFYKEKSYSEIFFWPLISH